MLRIMQEKASLKRWWPYLILLYICLNLKKIDIENKARFLYSISMVSTKTYRKNGDENDLLIWY